MPSLSIALATYNGQSFIEAQLDSVTRQTFAPSELVVSDDASSDATVRIVEAFARQAAFPVRLIRNEHRLGYRANFMRAAAACTSDLIAFCDQDDIWHPTKLAVMRGCFADPDVLLAFHNAELMLENGTIGARTFRMRAPKTYAPLTMYPWTIIPGLTQTVRASLVRFTPLHAGSIDPYAPSELMPHDQWYPFWASVLGRVAYVPQPLALYRLHDTNTSGWPASIPAFLVDRIGNAGDYVAANAISAHNRLDLLERARPLLQPAERARLDAAVAYYQALSAESDRRLCVYKGPRSARLRALFALIRQGTYTRATSDAQGLDTLLLDVCVGLAFSRLGRQRPPSADPLA